MATNNATANEFVLLEKNAPAPYSGVLMPVEQAQKLRKDLIELDSIKLINESLNKSISLHLSNEEILEKKIQILNDRNLKLNESLSSEKKASSLERLGYFALGAVLTGLASYGIFKAAVAK